jgi:hypothetical protein
MFYVSFQMRSNIGTICMYVCMLIWIYIYILRFTLMYEFICIYIDIDMYINMCTHSNLIIFIYTYIHSDGGTVNITIELFETTIYMYIYLDPCINTCMHLYVYYKFTLHIHSNIYIYVYSDGGTVNITIELFETTKECTISQKDAGASIRRKVRSCFVIVYGSFIPYSHWYFLYLCLFGWSVWKRKEYRFFGTLSF